MIGIEILGPSAEESHDTCAEDDAKGSIDDLTYRSFVHFLVEEEFVCKELDETSVEQDARAERVEDAAYDGGGGGVGVVSGADAQTGGNANGSGETVCDGTDEGGVFV